MKIRFNLNTNVKRVAVIIIITLLFICFSIVTLIRADSADIPNNSYVDINSSINDSIIVTKETENITVDTNTNSNSDITQPNLNQVNLEKIVETATNSLNISDIKNDILIENIEPETEAKTFYYGKRYNYNFSENDMILMCTVVSSETGYCADKEQKAVAHTILNRLKSKDFPDTIYEVVTQENQYTAVHGYFDGQYRKGLYPGSELWNHTMEICYEAIDEWDFTCGAVAYYNPKINGYNDWFESLNLVYEDDCGRFFAI